MGIIEAYKALKDIKYRASDEKKQLQIFDVNDNHVMMCKGETCFELFKPEIRGNHYVVPIIKWRGNGSKFKSLEKKYITITDFNYYTNTGSFDEFVKKTKKIKEVESDILTLMRFFEYLNLLFT